MAALSWSVFYGGGLMWLTCRLTEGSRRFSLSADALLIVIVGKTFVYALLVDLCFVLFWLGFGFLLLLWLFFGWGAYIPVAISVSLFLFLFLKSSIYDF